VKRRPAFFVGTLRRSRITTSIRALRLAIRSLQDPDGYMLEDFAYSARKIVDGTQDALYRHTSEHGC
jgi:hypothetical protein